MNILTLYNGEYPLKLGVFLATLTMISSVNTVVILTVFCPARRLRFVCLICTLTIVVLLVIVGGLGIHSTVTCVVPKMFLFVFVFGSNVRTAVTNIVLTVAVPTGSSVGRLHFCINAGSLLRGFHDIDGGRVSVLTGSRRLSCVREVSGGTNTVGPLLGGVRTTLRP